MPLDPLDFQKGLTNNSKNTNNSPEQGQILVIDDTPENLKLVSHFLRDAGFQVRVAKNGVQGLKVLEKIHPDLILLDVMMPEMDGFETCRRLKQWDKTKDIPVIFMTAAVDTSNPQMKVKGLSLGAVDYLSKPIQLEEVLARVKIHLNIRFLTQQLQAQNRQLEQEIRDRKQAEAELAENARRLALRSDIGLALSRESDLSTMLFRCTQAFVQHLDVAFARIWTLNPDENILELQASAGMYTHINGLHAKVPVGDLKIGRIASQRQPHLTNDVLSDPYISDPEWAQREGMVSFAGYPLIVEDDLVGVMAMFARHPLSPMTLDTLTAVANEIAVGIERQQLDQALQYSQRWLKAINQANPNIIYVHDWLERRNVYANREIYEILGYTPKEVQEMGNQVLARLMHPDDFAILPNYQRQIQFAQPGEVFEQEYRMCHKNGEWRWFFAQEILFKQNPDGTTQQTLGVAIDISDRKKAELQLEKHNYFLQQIATNTALSHILEELALFVEEQSGQIRCSFLLLDEQGKLHLGAAPSLPAAYNQAIDGISIGPHVGSCGTAAYYKKNVMVSDISTDPLWADFKDLALSHGLRACWSIPILSGDGIVLGTFAGYYNQPQIVRELDQRLIEQILYLAKIAIERERSQAALCQSEERLHLALEASGDGLWDWNIQTAEVYFSHHWLKILGYQSGELPGHLSTWEKLIHPDDQPWVLELLQMHLQNHAVPYRFDYRLLTKFGHYQWISNYGKVVADDEKGSPLRMIGIHRDISDRKHIELALQESEVREREKAQALQETLQKLKQTQAQLIQTEKMSSLGRMIGGVAHEINNPANFIYGNITYARTYFEDLLKLVKLYQQTYPKPTAEICQLRQDMDLDFMVEDWYKLINSMQLGVQRIERIVLSLKSFSKLDEAEIKAVDIHEAIDNILFILKPKLRAEGNRPEIQVIKKYGQMPCINCYASQLNQVFINILDNAIEALDSKPAPRLITIKTEVLNHSDTESVKDLSGTYLQEGPSEKDQDIDSILDSSIRIQISDNGMGINENVRQHIFDPFFTTKPVGSGTGLGLAVSHQIIVEKHQGKISCVSELGQGTTFIIEIPIHP